MSTNVRASLYMMLSMAGFTFNDVLIKSLDGVLPTTQVMGVRGAFLSVLVVMLLWRHKLLPLVTAAFTPLVGLRAAMELLATLFFLTALTRMSFASISAILQALPLAVTFGAALLFREQVGWRRWLAILVGFAGVLIIIRPGTSGFQSASLLVIAAVVFAAGRDLATRALPSSIPSLIVTSATAVLITAAGTAITLFRGAWVPMQGVHLATLALASLFLFFGYQFIVLAMRSGDIAYVAPYRYTSLLWAVGLGYLVFAEVPDGWTIVGSLVVISMGLFTMYREVLRSRQSL